MITYSFLQQYWWFIISLLGGILVFLLFVQGANTMLFSLGKRDADRRLIMGATGRKWEVTFTTLVTFGGAFFASFPLFYSTSFGGAYWLWMLILFSFVVQAVSYEFQDKLGNFLGARTFQVCLVINGIVGPLLLGGAVATFFDGSNFVVDKLNITDSLQPVISRWANASGGLDALLDVWNLFLGLAVLFLARVLGLLYMINNLQERELVERMRHQLVWNAGVFLLFFLIFFVHVLFKDGYAYDATGLISLEPMKYLHNLVACPFVLVLLLAGVVLLLAGIILTVVKRGYRKGIWFSGLGTVLAVTALFLMAGWNDTAYYPSNVDLQSSLTIVNSSSSEYTLRTMAVVSLLVPFVIAYIWYAWRKIDIPRH